MTFVYPRESLSAFSGHLAPAYQSSIKRAPKKPLIIMPHTLSELTGPVYGHETVRPAPVKFGSSGAGCWSRTWT